MRAADPRRAVDLCKVPEVIFPNWRELLNQADLPERIRAGYGLAIGAYLEYCHRNAVSVTTESARGYMADVQRTSVGAQSGALEERFELVFHAGPTGIGVEAFRRTHPGPSRYWDNAVGTAADRTAAAGTLLVEDRADVPGLCSLCCLLFN